MIRIAGSLPAGAAAARAAAERVAGRLAVGAPIAILLALLASPMHAQSVAATANGSIIVAHDGVVDLYAPDAKRRIWRVNGVPYSGAIAIGGKDVAVLDPLDNRAVIIDVDSGAPRAVRTGETPIASAFAGRDLYVLDRDAGTVERITPDGTAHATVAVGADSAFLRESNGRLYVYARTGGTLQEITLAPFAVSRSTPVPPFASDLEVDRRTAYLVYPAGQRDVARLPPGPSRDAVERMSSARAGVLAVDLATMQPASRTPIGAVPVELALVARSLPTSSVTVAVADPSSRRVWMAEGEESVAHAFTRGFLQGLFGLGASGKDVAFESGVDRLSLNGSSRIAYDSASGTLYSFSKKKVSVLARGIAPHAFTAIPAGAVWWQSGTLVAQRENR